MQVILNIHVLTPGGIMVMEKSWKLFSIFNDFSTKLKKCSCDEIHILSGCDEIETCKMIFLCAKVGLRLSY